MKDKILISPEIRRFLRIWSWIGIFTVLLFSILDIIGWIFNIPVLTGLSPYFTPMKPITAVSFLLCSAAIISLAIDAKSKIRKLIINLSALIIGLIALFTLISYLGFYITGKEMDITSLPMFNLFLDSEVKMAFLTGCCFLIISMVFFLHSTNKPQAIGVAHGLIMFPLSLSYLVLLSYVLDVYQIHEIQNIPVALNTGISIFLICVVILFRNPESWIMNKFTGHYAGSLMARKLLPWLIILPVIIGWLRIQGEELGFFKSEVGVTLVALTYTLCFLGLVWLTSFSVNRSDKERVRNETLLSKAQQIAKIGSWEWNVLTGKIYWSDQMYEVFGEVKGKFMPTYEGFMSHVHPDDRQKVEDAVKETIENDTLFRIEYRVLNRTAGELYVAAHADIVRDANNEPQLFIGTCLDITERKKYEEALQSSREYLATTLASIGDAVIATDTDGNITFLNRVGEDLTGWKYEDAVGKPAKEIFHIINERTRLEAENPVAKVIKTGIVEGLANHTLLVRKDGTEIPIENSGAPIHGKSGEIAGVVLVFRDITRRKITERALADSEQRYKLLVESLPDSSVLLFDHDHRFLITRGAEIMNSGFDPEKIEGRTLKEAFPAEVAELFTPLYNKALKGESTSFEHEYGEFVYSQQIIPVYGVNGEINSGLVLSRNITAQKKAQEEIRRSNDYLEKIYNYANAAFVCWTPDNKITRFNHAFERMTGYLAEEVLGRDLSLLFPGDSIEESQTRIKNALSGEFWADVEIPILRKDGEIRIALWNSANIYEEDGKTLITTIAQGQDITARKMAEDALRESQERFRSVLDNSNDMIYRLNLQTEHFEYISPSAERVLGHSPEELASMDGSQSMSIIHPDDLENVNKMLEKLEKTGTEIVVYRIKLKDGNYRWISNHMSLVYDKKGKPLYRDGNVRDITEIKRFEDEIIAANQELTLFNTAMVGRELRMIELKKEINQICTQFNLPPVYEIENEEVIS